MSTKSITPLPNADFTPEMGNYRTLQPFRYWCQKVLPLVYDDSLSYYELLCKVVDYLNKTMEDVETLHGDVTNLHTAYEQLQNYVNVYFSSLDVQQEINNKLDDMAKNGSLSAIIAPLIAELGNPIIVDNVNEMTNVNRIYILSSNAILYYYNGTNFVPSGIVYNSTTALTPKGVLASGNLDDVNGCSIHWLNPNNEYENAPVNNVSAILITLYPLATSTNILAQFYFSLDGLSRFMRFKTSAGFTGWMKTSLSKGQLDSGMLADVVTDSINWLNPNKSYPDAPYSGISSALFTFYLLPNSTTIGCQFIFSLDGTKEFKRFRTSTGWGEWKSESLSKGMLEPTSLDNITENSIHWLNPNNEYENAPVNNVSAILITLYPLATSTNILAQFYFSLDGLSRFMRFKTSAGFTGWMKTSLSKGQLDSGMLADVVTDSINWLNPNKSYPDAPYSGISSALFTFYLLPNSTTIGCQFIFSLDGTKEFKRFRTSTGWGEWKSEDSRQVKIAMLGSSVIWGSIGGQWSANNIPKYVSDKVKCQVTNFGAASEGWLAKIPASQPESNGGIPGYNAYERVTGANLPSDKSKVDLTGYDIIVVQWGSNDLGYELGNIDDNDPNTTVCGNINLTIKYICENYPNAVLLYLMPLPGKDGTNSVFPEWRWGATYNGVTGKQYVDKYIEIANKYHLPYLDFFNCPINSFNITTYLNDLIHYSEAGYKLLGEYIGGFIENFVM